MIVFILMMSLGGYEEDTESVSVEDSSKEYSAVRNEGVEDCATMAFTAEEYDWAMVQAEILSTQLTRSIASFPSDETDKYHDLGINTFIMITVIPEFIEVEEYRYANFFRRVLSFYEKADDLDYANTYHFFFSADRVVQMVHEVFGIEFWFYMYSREFGTNLSVAGADEILEKQNVNGLVKSDYYDLATSRYPGLWVNGGRGLLLHERIIYNYREEHPDVDLNSYPLEERIALVIACDQENSVAVPTSEEEQHCYELYRFDPANPDIRDYEL